MSRTSTGWACLGLVFLLGACSNAQAPRTPTAPPPTPGATRPAPPRTEAPAPPARTWQPQRAMPANPSGFGRKNLPFEQLLAEVRQTGRPGLLYFRAEWCGFCTKLDRLTLSRPDVQQAIRAGFVSVEYDVDTPLGRQVANRYGANGFPTMVVVDAQGEVTKTIVGYRDGAALLGVLRAP